MSTQVSAYLTLVPFIFLFAMINDQSPSASIAWALFWPVIIVAMALRAALEIVRGG